ncbi:hypothetical protein FRUB_10464 [Fimbriiglobus ruber]|uniref:Uncharacterized protein n=1 Tax=Fimbriiglobus ruber TaxID=1908690 RepID=A0A225D0N4_9BACT|nr:hypothetical protein FRUB_10464 [Fimbriiglobus ruber]
MMFDRPVTRCDFRTGPRSRSERCPDESFAGPEISIDRRNENAAVCASVSAGPNRKRTGSQSTAPTTVTDSTGVKPQSPRDRRFRPAHLVVSDQNSRSFWVAVKFIGRLRCPRKRFSRIVLNHQLVR